MEMMKAASYGRMRMTQELCFVHEVQAVTSAFSVLYRLGAAQLQADGISSCCYIVYTQPSVMSYFMLGRRDLVL
jgi:hypothetical protein